MSLPSMRAKSRSRRSSTRHRRSPGCGARRPRSGAPRRGLAPPGGAPSAVASRRLEVVRLQRPRVNRRWLGLHKGRGSCGGRAWARAPGGGRGPERRRGEGWGTRGIASLEEVPPAGAAGSQAWADGRTKTNVAPKNVHTLFFLVVGDSLSFCVNSLFFCSLSYMLVHANM